MKENRFSAAVGQVVESQLEESDMENDFSTLELRPDCQRSDVKRLRDRNRQSEGVSGQQVPSCFPVCFALKKKSTEMFNTAVMGRGGVGGWVYIYYQKTFVRPLCMRLEESLE